MAMELKDWREALKHLLKLMLSPAISLVQDRQFTQTIQKRYASQIRRIRRLWSLTATAPWSHWTTTLTITREIIPSQARTLHIAQLNRLQMRYRQSTELGLVEMSSRYGWAKLISKGRKIWFKYLIVRREGQHSKLMSQTLTQEISKQRLT